MRRRGNIYTYNISSSNSSLVASYSLDETTGATLFDGTGSNNAPYNHIPATTIAGQIGTAIDFSLGTGSAITPSSTAFNLISDGVNNKTYSLSFWIKQTNATSIRQYLEAKIGANKVFWIGVSANIFRIWHYKPDNSYFGLEPSSGFVNGVNTWRKVDITFNPNNAEHTKFYLNGSKISGTLVGTTGLLRSGTPALTIGSTNAGAIDDIKIRENIELTAEQILNSYNSEI